MRVYVDHGFGSLQIHHITAFDTYEVIAPRIVYLDDTSIVEVIGMGSIIMEEILKR